MYGTPGKVLKFKFIILKYTELQAKINLRRFLLNLSEWF